jgi:putrescine---pyruvate transaminase
MPSTFLHPFSNPSRDSFISIARGEGALLWTTEGRELVDALGSLWYCNVGHGRREIADAVYAQMQVLETYSCFEPFTNDPADALAERIAGITPMPDARVFFTCSGSEAVDTAMKLARGAHVQAGNPQRTLIVSRGRGYHGTAWGGTSAQGIALNREGWGPLLTEVIQVPSDDIEAMASLMAERGHEIAAVIAEPIQGAGGVWPPVEGYLQGLRRLCDQHGAYLIFDEVISGFGRTGSWFAANTFGVTPDMTTFAKGVTSGYLPLGGVIIGGKVRAGLEANPEFFMRHGFTYSGHASVCAAGLVNIDIIEREGLAARATHVGDRLSVGLRALADDGSLAGVRGLAAIWAVQTRPDQLAKDVHDRMYADSGVVVRAIGTDTLVFCPPLVITDDQIDRIIDAVAKATVG